ncbi:membrane protein of unknown function [Acidithiobacillus ferrivorans]|jgi:hypothetical protein|uniref:Uncharacterized protein n=1 Tax=Acidithiobacillus ferrivorans TaxID=160808 RepID=A0A060UT99_9PROT|nr:hypothetical protein [Acidithiobacillus ferrivorans]CDQ09983.1 membrane hypothetical protein [Acidithiobacillus ferrivorans]SMH65689.1 membrane protein of unknown function [Acidithiobacillus ferrivorans]
MQEQQLMNLAREYYRDVYGLLIGASYWKERFFIGITNVVMLWAVLSVIIFTCKKNELWHSILELTLFFLISYAIYLFYIIYWLNKAYQKRTKISKTGIQYKEAVINNLEIRYNVGRDDIVDALSKTLLGKSMLYALTPFNPGIFSLFLSLLIAAIFGLIFSGKATNNVWLIIADVVSVSAYLFIQYAICVRAFIWRMEEGIIPARYLPLYFLRGDIEKINFS